MKLLLILSLLLSACTTTRTPLKVAEPAHWSRVTAYNKELPTTTSKVVVVRDTGFTGSACNHGVAINEESAGEIDVGKKIAFYVEPGGLHVAVGPSPGSICGLAKPWRSINTTIEDGETKYFRTGFYMDYLVFIPFFGMFMDRSHRFIQPYDDPEPGPLEVEPYEEDWE